MLAALSAQPATRVRYLVLLSLGIAACCAYLTRVLAASNTTIRAEFGLSNQEMGYVLAGFAAGYLVFQIPGGWIVNRLGARIMLPAIGVCWSLCTVWASLATSGVELRWSRFALGIAQAALMPSAAQVLSDWFPDRQRGMASAFMSVSMSAGAVLATGLTALLLPVLGWREILRLYSSVGIIWALAFYLWFRNRPQEHPRTNEAERQLIAAGRSADDVDRHRPRQSSAGPAGARLLLVAVVTSSSMWAVCSQAFFRAFGYEFFASWFPAYLERGHGVRMVNSGLLATAPLIASGAGSLLGGWVIDLLLRRTGSRWLSRSGTAMIALALCASCTLAAAWATNPALAVGIISCGAFFSGFSSPATWAVTLDISGKHTAVVFGIMNLLGSLGAATCPVVVGGLFDHIARTRANWNLVLYLFVAVYLAAAIASALLNPHRSAVERRLAKS